MRRALLIAGGVAAAALVLLHVPLVARSLGGCPFGYDKPIATAVHGAPQPALGFALDATTGAQIRAWATAHAIACTPHRGALECAQVPASLLGEAGLATTSAWFALDGSDTLRAIHTVRRTRDPQVVAAAFDAAEMGATRALGTPVVTAGDPTTLADGALRQAMAEHRTPHLSITLRATNMGDGYALTESYAVN